MPEGPTGLLCGIITSTLVVSGSPILPIVICIAESYRAGDCAAFRPVETTYRPEWNVWSMMTESVPTGMPEAEVPDTTTHVVGLSQKSVSAPAATLNTAGEPMINA